MRFIESRICRRYAL